MIKAQAGTHENTSHLIAELRRAHSEYERQLSQLNRSRHLTPTEQVEVRRLKRLKLQAKDRISLLQSCRS